MKVFRAFFSCVATLAASGCATHPLPENFEGYNTLEIVEHIRCEARQSVQDNAIGFLRGEGNNKLADELAADRSGFQKFDPSRLSTKQEKDFYSRYIKTGIALDLTLDISEDNVASTQLDFLKLISNGTFSLAVAASNDRLRDASRQFVVTDTFKNLLDDPRVCERGSTSANLLYPITGTIGLAELLGTFIQLNEDGIELKAADKAPVFADTLNFTTTFSGSVTPKVTLTPAGHNFHLADAALTNMATRKDANKVIVGLSLAPKEKNQGARGVVGSPFVGNFGTFATVFAKRGLSEAEIRAVQAISQTRIDTFLDHFGRVVVQ